MLAWKELFVLPDSEHWCRDRGGSREVPAPGHSFGMAGIWRLPDLCLITDLTEMAR